MSVLDKEIPKKEMNIIIAVILATNFFIYILNTLIIQNSYISYELNVNTVGFTILFTGIYISKFKAKKNKSYFTLRYFLRDIETTLNECVKMGEYFISFVSPYRKRVLVSISILAFWYYFTEPLLNVFSSYLRQDISSFIETLSMLGVRAIATLLVVFLVFFFLVTILKYVQIKNTTKELYAILDSLHEINIQVLYKHVNGKRIMDTDKLLDDLIEQNNETAHESYIRIKYMYKNLQEIDVVPKEFKKTLF